MGKLQGQKQGRRNTGLSNTAKKLLRFEQLEKREMMASDMVLTWNDRALAAIKTASSAPPVASRNLAIVHVAVYDALNAIDRTGQPYAVDVLAQPSASRGSGCCCCASRLGRGFILLRQRRLMRLIRLIWLRLPTASPKPMA
ncbi:MAG: hypothetical protein U0894_03040 [Pirellulales bacterium]